MNDPLSPPPHPFIEWLDQSKRLLFLLLLVTFGLLSLGGLFISSLSADYGLMVFGSDPALWNPGQTVAIRLEGRELFLNHSIDLKKADAYLEQINGHQVGVFPIKQKLGPYLQGNVVIPKSVGKWRLRIQAEGLYTPLGKVSSEEVSLETYLDFTLSTLTKTLPPPLEAAKRPTSLRERQGQGVLSLFALHQRLSFELPSEIMISAVSKDKRPWSTSINISEVMGLTDPPLPKKIQTSQSGLARIKVKVRSPNLQFQIQSEDTLTLEQLWPQAHHFTLTTPIQLHNPHTYQVPIEIQADRVHPFLFLDIWVDGVWSKTHALFPQDKIFNSFISLPPLKSLSPADPYSIPAELIWIQVYDSTYFPKERKGGIYILRPYQSEKEYFRKSVFPWLKKQLLDLKVESTYWKSLSPSHFDDPNVIAFALGRLKRPDTDPQVISDSGTSSQIMIDQMKMNYQRLFMMGMLGFGCLVCLLLGLLMWNHHQQLKKQMWSPSQLDQSLTYSSRDLWIKWFGPAFFLLVCFFGGMMYLIWVLNQS